ncbi:DUF5392 family protein, partial [Bacillus sp. GbtcB13]|uniref:DUF5392 family protein n=1 Tax=Bacillus sp. GbtcB13 TaxID=2824758 RepID=UPI001C2F2B9C
ASYGTDSMIKIGCPAPTAAFGMALFRESSYQKRNVQQSVMKYIMERMQTSEVLPDERKSRYDQAVKEEPLTGMRSV